MRILATAFLLFFIQLFSPAAFCQGETELVKKVKAKLDKVSDYQAEAVMKIDVSFIKAPNSAVKVFYKKPDKFSIKKDGGISILPKGGVSVNLNSIITTGNYTIVPAGESGSGSSKLKIVKLLPEDEKSDVVVTTLYIDAANALIKKSIVTTKENGTYEMQMTYGKYSEWGLPDQVVFIFSTKDYKLPKGMTFEYESGKEKVKSNNPQNTKGKIEVAYSNYVINKGIPDSSFQ